MKSESGIIGWAMKYNKIILLIVIVLSLFGIYALNVMPKQEFPVFTIRQGVVVGVYPGATSAEVEEQLAKPLENFLFTYKEVKKSKTYSHSKDGIVYVYVELNDDVNNKDEVWSKIKHGLMFFKMQLPSGVLALIANDDFGDTSALLITLESETKTYRQLETYLENLEDRLRTIESVSNLRRYGEQNEQISIYVEKEKLAAYGINILNLYQTLITKGFITTAGKIDNRDMDVPIHIERPYQSEKDLEEQIIYSDAQGNHIRLKNIAKVVREYPKPTSYTTNNGKKCLVLSTEMREGYNVIQYGKDVEKVLEQFQNDIPSDIHIYRVADQPQVVAHSITTFLKELMIAIVAVILVTMILLPLRVAGVAASSIPISIFISLGLMLAFGMELNTVTLAALIVVLGMIVDNSIVVVDSYLEKLDHGIPRWQASIESAKEYAKAIISATLAISLTFFPFLVMLTGQFLDFVKLFPWTVLITLGVSLAVAVLFIPFLQYFFIRNGLHQPGKKQKETFLDKLQNGYNWLLEKVFQYPKISLTIGIISIISGIYMFANVPQKLMPIAERNQFAVEIYLPNGSSLEQTKVIAQDLEKVLRKEKTVVSVTSFIGTGSPRFQTAYAPKVGGPNFAQFIVNTTSNEDTELLLDKYSTQYAYHYPNAFVKFKQLEYESVDADIDIRISGENIADLKKVADTLMTKLKKLDEPIRIYTNYEEPLPGIKITLDPVESNRLGVNEGTLALGLASRFGGTPITNIWENDYSLPVVLKSKWENKDPVAEDVSNEYVAGLLSPSVPLRQIADVSANWTEGQINRRNGVRTLSVFVDLKRGERSGLVQPKVEEIVNAVTAKSLPKGVSISYGGVKESDGETMPKLIKALSISIVIIFFILVFHFKKISLATLVLASTSLSIFGAAIGLKVMNVDFSITAVLGIVSLIGIIVRNGIIMYDYTEELRHKHGKTVFEASLEAGKRRMRPIFLTSAAASMGVIPMIISKSPLWCPMGTVISFGTIFSMIFILTLLPLAYWLIYKHEDKNISKDETEQL
ncbi:MAG: efflux RND transporter permease subunit [Dysgonomonas mossii]|uniref:efflux RND transporter permease subunit n=1 Tax=Dysgonomonas mossii TaxID=163665 RepID=UPI001D8C0CD7|nr:efflux RND transporter permease subunit [Dysgonomonas mossii]MBS5796508.1 efflux RND transporter permease subunit [Dysgonomonas mossii]MBS7111754.1 efflux RND transporter permease subunit [Dysgonomonas mossii]